MQEIFVLVLAATSFHEPSLLLVVTDGAEPKKKRERSAKPCLVVQFHPAPPLLRAAAKAIMATGPTRYTYYKQDGFEVWGKQYQDSAGGVTWRLRVFSEQDRRINTYEDVAEVPPEGKRTGESEAIRDALAAWLAPVQDAPVQDAPVQDAPVQDAPAQDAPAQDEPVQDEPDANAHLEIPNTAAVPETATLQANKLRLNEEERRTLSPRALAYIEYLEQELSRGKR